LSSRSGTERLFRPDRDSHATGISVTLTGTDSVAGLTNGEGAGWQDDAARGQKSRWQEDGAFKDKIQTKQPNISAKATIY
jgi:hypothetical protein